MSQLTVVEVGLRDGLQNESVHLTVEQRFQILKVLMQSGLKRIEVGAFVRSDKVPQMAGTAELLALAQKYKSENKKFRDVKFSVLIPNLKGWEEAEPLKPDEVALFASATESFSQKNINCSIDESFKRFEPVIAHAKKRKIKIRGYLSVCFGCPFEGPVAEKQVLKLIDRMMKMEVDEVSIGDTIGIADVGQIQKLFKKIKSRYPMKKMAGHFHDTRGQALANIHAAYQLGVRIFDSSVGGLGGCPYAPGSSGNVATEDLLFMAHGMRVKTGVQIQPLIELNQQIGQWMSKSLPSKVAKAGIPTYKNP